MRNLMTLIAATSAALSLRCAYAQNPLPKASDVLVKYGDEVEGWTVYENQTRGDCRSCANMVRVRCKWGSPQMRRWDISACSRRRISAFKNGTKSEIFVSIGGNLYGGVATSTRGELKGGYSGGYILTDNPNFKRDVAKKYEMIVFPETKGAFVVDLKGTYKAMAMGRKCLTKSAAAATSVP